MNQVQAEQQQTHPAAVAQEFMKRTELKGGEVEVYAQTFNWLGGFLDESLVLLTKEDHLAVVAELQELREFRKEHDPVIDELEEVDSEESEEL